MKDHEAMLQRVMALIHRSIPTVLVVRDEDEADRAFLGLIAMRSPDASMTFPRLLVYPSARVKIHTQASDAIWMSTVHGAIVCADDLDPTENVRETIAYARQLNLRFGIDPNGRLLPLPQAGIENIAHHELAQRTNGLRAGLEGGAA